MHARGHLIKGHGAAVMLAALMLVSGCQGGSSNAELSKREFVARANDICKTTNQRIAALPAPDIADPNATPKTIARVIELQRDAASELRALDPPAEDVPAIDEWLKFVDVALAQAQLAQRALERDDRTSLNDANAKGRDAQVHADELARLYGVDRCATAPDEPTTST